MARFDLDLEELTAYRPAVEVPADFDAFWSSTLAESRALWAEPRVTQVASPLTAVDVYDLQFSGFGGEPIAAWYLRPRGSEGPLPTVVEYHGYGGGRGLPHERLGWAASGYAYLTMDVRGQGSGWGVGGITPDPHGSGPAVAGFLTRGIHDPLQYFYRRVFTDAALLIDAARALPGVDADRIIVSGTSQGGGIAIAAAGLVPGLWAAMPDVPFLCHFRRAIGLTDTLPYREVVDYLAVHRDRVKETFKTLSYFDGVAFAARAEAPALFSAALMDQICPPSTVFAAANQWAGGAQVEVYPYNQHEGGLGAQWIKQAQWLSFLSCP